MVIAIVSPPAQAQVPVRVVADFSGVQAAVTNAASITPTNAIVELRKNQGIAILPRFVGTGASTANVTFTFNVSADGTNYTTTGPLTYTAALNGTTPVVGYKLFTATDLNNVRYLKLSSVTNAGSVGCVISGIQYSYYNP